jgi:hypothetical protein
MKAQMGHGSRRKHSQPTHASAPHLSSLTFLNAFQHFLQLRIA